MVIASMKMVVWLRWLVEVIRKSSHSYVGISDVDRFLKVFIDSQVASLLACAVLNLCDLIRLTTSIDCKSHEVTTC